MSSSVVDHRHYVTVDWYLQQHGSFSSLGRWRDISLRQFSSTQELIDYLIAYIQKNYPGVYSPNQDYTVLDLCRLAIGESSKLLASNVEEISRVTSRHRWPPTHELVAGCLSDAHIVATAHHALQPTNLALLDNLIYCLITQLGNHPTHVKFLQGTRSLREEIFERFKQPFGTTSRPSAEQVNRFLARSETFSIQQLCCYVTGEEWHDLDGDVLHGVLVDFIVAGEPLLFDEMFTSTG